MSLREPADKFKALGDPTRLQIFQLLRECRRELMISSEGDVRPLDGPTVGEVCCQVSGAQKITSTISFHLKELRNAGLITVERRGKHMVCAVDQEGLRALSDFLNEPALVTNG